MLTIAQRDGRDAEALQAAAVGIHPRLSGVLVGKGLSWAGHRHAVSIDVEPVPAARIRGRRDPHRTLARGGAENVEQHAPQCAVSCWMCGVHYPTMNQGSENR